MLHVNEVELLGNVGKDPVVTELGDGKKRAFFSLATNEKYRDRDGNLKELTEWHTVVAFGQPAEAAEKMVQKGTPVLVKGRLTKREWQDEHGETRREVQVTVGRRGRLIVLPRAPAGEGSGQGADGDEVPADADEHDEIPV